MCLIQLPQAQVSDSTAPEALQRLIRGTKRGMEIKGGGQSFADGENCDLFYLMKQGSPLDEIQCNFAPRYP